MKEENKRMEVKETAKAAMQEEAEVGEPPVASTSCVPPSNSNPAETIEPSVTTESKPGKPDSKGKGKGKMLSSASRVTTGPAGIKKRKSLVPTSIGTPRMRLTRAAVLRQKAIQAQLRSPTKGKTLTARPSLFGAKSTKSSGNAEDEKEGSEKKGNEGPFAQPQRSLRKTFVLTVPSSLSPSKANSATSSANSSMTLKSTPADAGPQKPFSFSLYPPSMKDAAATARAQRALSNLSSALDKLAMPPPSNPSSSAGRTVPASEQKERARPATSLGFSREMSLPVTSSGSFGNKEGGRPRAMSRAGSVDPGQGKKSFFPPPPPPAFGSSLTRDKGKAKAFASASRTLPSGSKSIVGGGNQPRPPPTFNFGAGAGMNGGMAGVFGRPIPRIRASQRTSLETVEGSPVKGAAPPRMFAEDDEDEIVAADTVGGQEGIDVDSNVSATSLHSLDHQSMSNNGAGDTSISSAEGNNSTAATGETNVAMTESGKELKRISKLNASRRASMAFSALSQSLATSPDPVSLSSKDSNTSAEASAEQTPESSSAGKGRSECASLTSSTSSRPMRAAAPRSFSFGAPGLARAQSELPMSNNLRASSATPVGVSESDGEGSGKSSKKSGGGSMGRTKMPGSLDILDQCTIFVDVRTEEGEDAGALFVDMLRGLGAKVGFVNLIALTTLTLTLIDFRC